MDGTRTLSGGTERSELCILAAASNLCNFSLSLFGGAWKGFVADRYMHLRIR